jgi:purine-binding chemotaxis protein CheW
MSEQLPTSLEEVESHGWDELARSATSGGAESIQREDVRQLLTFEVAATPYAIPVERVREIVRIRPITPVPHVPAEVRGVISLRGEIVQVVDLRRRLDLEPADPVRSTRIIVVHSEEGKVAGILVDAVREVSRVSEDAIRPSASTETGAVESLCVRGAEFVSLIDLDRILQINVER